MSGHWRKYGVLASMYLFIGAVIFYVFDGKAFPIVFLSMGFAFWISLAIWISLSKKRGERRS
ncbi:hypothetical protein ACE1TH_15755 [Shouchella sp. JSM 1781072]|uniref:hypothetical protein n=1 Tax=Shouchella sp. JSM 1781072 TaxID=3344581 RepID=UPI0035C1F82C